MCFRFLYCPQLRIISIHFLELENEQPQKEFINEYQNDEPFNVYLERTKKIVKKTRNLKNICIENNLLFKVNNKMI